MRPSDSPPQPAKASAKIIFFLARPGIDDKEYESVPWSPARLNFNHVYFVDGRCIAATVASGAHPKKVSLLNQLAYFCRHRDRGSTKKVKKIPSRQSMGPARLTCDLPPYIDGLPYSTSLN
jgi:hypothetical protein